MGIKDIMPDFDPEYPIKMFNSPLGERLRTRFLGGIETTINEFQDSADAYIYMGNHTSVLDYVAANHEIIKDNLPYPVSVAGTNLNNWFYRKATADFNKWGVIWHDRENSSKEHIMTYFRALNDSLKNGRSILIYPEAKRNRNAEEGLLSFKEELFGGLYNIAKRLSRSGKQLAIAPFAIQYNDYPEKERWHKIDGRRGKFLGDASYYFHDFLSIAKWYLTPHENNTKVGFAKPIPFSEISSPQEASQRTREAIEETLYQLKTS